ncbi:unnamed protein product [marine sediment metagenome]|uniref:Uncharacterized protein n=1 Tax=marine sediment metagenome TaxID=412755 RepID=X0TPP2_9ZZZZ
MKIIRVRMRNHINYMWFRFPSRANKKYYNSSEVAETFIINPDLRKRENKRIKSVVIY